MNTDFETWWARNHPFDWWKKEHGNPLPDNYRLNVVDVARRAYEAGELARASQARDAAKDTELVDWMEKCLSGLVGYQGGRKVFDSHPMSCTHKATIRETICAAMSTEKGVGK